MFHKISLVTHYGYVKWIKMQDPMWRLELDMNIGLWTTKIHILEIATLM